MSVTNTHRWLSEDADLLVGLAADADGMHCDVAIVGSGYGGAVAAAALAGATRESDSSDERRRVEATPIRVFVLERGEEYLPGMFPAGFAELPGHVRFSTENGAPPRGQPLGLFDVRVGKDVGVLLGNGLGGGSLINAAVMEEPTDDAFTSGWPAGISAAALRNEYALARAMLDAGPWTGSTPPKFDSLMRTGKAMRAEESRLASIAIARKTKASPAGVDVVRCIECGDCATGCNFRAKHSLDVNYLARARANKARFFCGATVVTVTPDSGGSGYALEWAFTERSKAYADARSFTLRARRVILAAGALGSTEILLRSKAAGLTISEQVGTRFSTNGDMILAGANQDRAAHPTAQEGDAPETRRVGPTILGLVRKRVPGQRPLVFEEFAIPAPLRRLLGEVIASVGTIHGMAHFDRWDHGPEESGEDPLAAGDRLIEHTMIYGAMGDDGAAGKMALASTPKDVVDRFDGQLAIDWPRARDAPVFAAQLEQLRQAHEQFSGVGGRVLPNPMWMALPDFGGFQLPRGPVLTVHPLGGCPMADSFADGVVDSYGRVFDVRSRADMFPGLAVLDGSIIPVSLGINPSLTIAALAERAMPRLMADWGLVGRATTEPMLQPQPERRDRSDPEQPRPTTVSLKEQLTGTLKIGTTTYDATLRVRFAPIADVARFVRELPRTVGLDGELVLRSPAGAESTVVLNGAAQVLFREASTSLGRLSSVVKLALERLGEFVKGKSLHALSKSSDFIALCSHIGGVRRIDYELAVVGAIPRGAPFKAGDAVRLVKRLVYNERGNPLRQLSEGELTTGRGERTRGKGQVALDLSYFVRQLTPLLRVNAQQDQPNAVGDLAQLGLFAARCVLTIHALNFLRSPNATLRMQERLPVDVGSVEPEVLKFQIPSGSGAAHYLLSRYEPALTSDARPLLMIHGYGASGSTFAHRSVPNNAVGFMLATGREVWVLDLRTSIGLEQREYWSFEDVANDIPDAISQILKYRREHGQDAAPVDVFAHCVGSAMFCVAVLACPDLHTKIGSVALSQVGPLVRMSPMNHFRGYVASYFAQYLGSEQFDVQPRDEDSMLMLLLDGLLANFPYPDDDDERGRLHKAPNFARVRHRADAIFGQLMQLDQVGDDTLESLDSIYGWVMARTLAQTIHFAREQLVTDAGGLNRWIGVRDLAERFAFPLLIVHGYRNAVFDWRGSYESLWMLERVFGTATAPLPDVPPVITEDRVFGSFPRQLLVLAEHGHQDCLIGKTSAADVFAPIRDFLDVPIPSAHGTAKVDLSIDIPWIGPTLGWVRRAKDGMTVCRIGVHVAPAHATVRGVVIVPLVAGEPPFNLEDAVVQPVVDASDETPRHFAIDVYLRSVDPARITGFAVLTVHEALPRLPIPMRIGELKLADGVIAVPSEQPTKEVLKLLRGALADPALDLKSAIVPLRPAWLHALDAGPPTDALTFAAASCQYPAGLFDTDVAEGSYRRLVDRIEADGLQLLVLTGDQVYVDAAGGLFEPAGAGAPTRAHELNFRLPPFRRATRSLPTYMMLDDHEVGDNWEPGRPEPDAGPALAEYETYQRWHGPDRFGPSYSYRFTPGGFPFFVLDTRSQRRTRMLDPRAPGVALDLAEIADRGSLNELLTWLKNAPADRPKFIVSPAVVFPFDLAFVFGDEVERIGLDSWGGFPASLFELLTFIRDRPVPNVVFVSGDAHMSALASLVLHGGPSGDVEIHSIVSSGLHAPWPFANARPEQFVREGDVKLRRGGQVVLEATIATPLLTVSDGFAVIKLAQPTSGTWRLDVEFDHADGVSRFGRTLATGDCWRFVDGYRR